MYKTLCVVAMLVGLLALTGRTSSAAPAPFTSPLIVAKGRRVNQTAPIPTTTIFTPPQDGLFRLSVYATLVSNNPCCGTWWAYGVSWTDDAGPQFINTLLASEQATTGQFVQFFNQGFQIPLGGAVTTFEAKAGQPITHSVTFNNGSSDGTSYSLYYTLERLE
jgi:hypothetical protein